MSKIGKLPIQIPSNVTITIDGKNVAVKGALGELSYVLPESIELEQRENELVVVPKDESRQTKAFWGLWRSLLANAVEGVSKGFEKRLELVGVGYRVQKKGTGLELEVGFSHKVNYEPRDGVTLDIEKGTIIVKGIDKQKVGQVAAEIRAVRPPEPYKGKGIRYVGEVVKLKPGKTAKAGM